MSALSPGRWEEVRLKYLLKAKITGAWGGEPDDENSTVCIRAADFDTEHLSHRKTDLTKRRYENSEIERKRLLPGDLIIEKSGGGDNQPVGRVILFELPEEALCSNFLEILRPITHRLNHRFGAYLMYSLWSTRAVIPFIKQTTGIQNLDGEAYLNVKVRIPAFNTQLAIAAYVDQETAKLDALVEAKARLLELLAEKRRALITRAVTCGLNLNVPFRNSGIPWLGQIPAHWETCRIAWLFRDRDERCEPELPLLEVSINSGVVIREFSNDRIESTAEDFNTYKVARKGDVVFNKMRMWQGAVGVAPEDGLVSPDYTVAAPVGMLLPEYAGLLFRTEMFSAECARYSHGIVWDRLRLYWEEFRNIVVPLPPPAEQRAIVGYISTETAKSDALMQVAERTIGLLKERRAALIAAAVTGKIESLS